MPYSEKLAGRIRQALAHLSGVEEKQMFRGMTFMVNGKMCVNVSGEDLMVRIDPDMHNEAVKRKGARTMRMKGREYKGFIYISEEGMKSNKDFDYWVALALDFNKRAKASKKKRAGNP